MRTYSLAVVLVALSTMPIQADDDASLFDRIDKNGDGQVTADEVDAQHQRLFQRMLRTSDANGDGQLTAEEFADGTTPEPQAANRDRPEGARQGVSADQLITRIMQADANGDGMLSRQEAPERLTQTFDGFDTNSDNKLDESEVRKLAEHILEERAGGGNNSDRAASDRPDRPQQRDGANRDPREAFGRLDKNEDGQLSGDEIPERMRQNMERIDEDENGSISLEEFLSKSPSAGRQANQPNGDRQQRDGANRDPAQLFNRLDKDGDGQLSGDEIIERLKRNMERVDQDENGSISLEELTRFLSNPQRDGNQGQREGGQANQLIRRIMEADENGDGKISREEAPERLAQAFDRADANSDDQLDEAEIRKLAERIMQRRREGSDNSERPARPRNRDAQPNDAS